MRKGVGTISSLVGKGWNSSSKPLKMEKGDDVGLLNTGRRDILDRLGNVFRCFLDQSPYANYEMSVSFDKWFSNSFED